MSKNIVLEFKGKVDALIITPELGCCKKSTSYSDIIEILGEDHEKMIIGGMALFMAKNSASIPYNEIEENPTKLIYFDNNVILIYGTVIICKYEETSKTGKSASGIIKSFTKKELIEYGAQQNYKPIITNVTPELCEEHPILKPILSKLINKAFVVEYELGGTKYYIVASSDYKIHSDGRLFFPMILYTHSPKPL